MSVRNLDAVFYAGDVPDVHYREGMFHCSYAIRDCRFEFVMPPTVFIKALLMAEEARAEWQLETIGSANVLPIRGKKR